MEEVVVHGDETSTQHIRPASAVYQNGEPIAPMQPAPPTQPYTFQATTQPSAVRKVEYPAIAQDTLQRAQALQAKRQRLSRDKHQTKFS